MRKRFGVIGGDRRQAELARLLVQEDYVVRTCGLSLWQAPGETTLETAAQADIVVLPMPLCKEPGLLNWSGDPLSTAELFSCFRPEQQIYAGKVENQQAEEAQALGLTLRDYLKREELAVANAIPTAEGAIQLAMEHLPVTLWGTEVLVLGYGRIGKVLARELSALGAKVTVAARKAEDRIWAESFPGCLALSMEELDGNLDQFRAVFNTVPAMLLDRSRLEQLRPDCLCMDLASCPGLDAEAAEVLGLSLIWAKGLPGKVAPVTAAKAIRDTIVHDLEERGELT